MHTFKDNADRTWTVTINVAAVKRVRGTLSIDLYKVVEDGFKALADILSDPVALVDVLYVLCQDEARQRQVSDEDFGRAMGGDAILHAADAFMEELVGFFPDPRSRAALHKVIEKSRQVRGLVIEHCDQQIEAIDPAREARMLIASSGSVPASSVSTPGT